MRTHAMRAPRAGSDARGANTLRNRFHYLPAWTAERFPLRNGIFFLVLYVTSLCVARAAATPGSVHVRWHDLAGFVALWAFFLVLRVVDEHKDFTADGVAHPERVLQRGLVTLTELRLVGILAALLTLGVSLSIDGGIGTVTGWWLAVAVWSGLMAREFFVRTWLRGHVMLYALSHMVVMPLVIGWVAAMGGASPLSRSGTQLLMLFGFASGLAFEMARKVRAPSDERPMADSYTRALGIAGAAGTLLGVTIAAMLVGLGVIRAVLATLPLLSSVACIAAAVSVAPALLAFARQPTTQGARRVEAWVGLSMLVVHLSVIASIVAGRGVATP